MTRRQTDYSLEKLRKILQEGEAPSGERAPGALCKALSSGLPVGLVMNEIGLIFLAGGEEGGKAEADLLAMLQSGQEKRRLTALFFLKSGIAVAGPAALEALADFEAAPQNKKTVQLIQEKLDS
jgi:hypothetical protein